MEIKIIENQAEWNGWIKEHTTHASLTQSYEWGEILKKEGKQVECLGVYEGAELTAIAQVVYSNLMFDWKYGFCAKGPVISEKFVKFIKSLKSGEPRGIQEVYEVLSSYLKKRNCLFFRIEPQEFHVSRFTFHVKKTIDIQPRATLFLDLQQSEEELLSAMHQKTRYNIKLAERKDLTIVDKKDADGFIALLKKTGTRDGFRLHEENHYCCILDSEFSKQLSILYNDQVIAMGVFIGFGDTFTYLYGASNYEFRQTMAPYLIQWEAIKLGKRLGYRYYDFYGVAPTHEEQLQNQPLIFNASEYSYNEQHKHAGFTRFKLGFGGMVEQNVGTWDIVLRPGAYKFYELVRKMRRLV
jgi:lipid II:glycine glycyltransferase (peptidoglycan interpeptide bridge formation enzyme)